MSNLVQSLLESANPYNNQLGVAQRLSKKWAKSGLLEGLKDYDRNNMALILENQAKQLVMEQSNTGGGTTSGATFTPGVGEQWAGVALPLVRKIFGQISAKEFVSVQPMNLPAGLVFFLDFQYGNNIPKPFSTTAGANSVYGTQSTVGDSTFGNTAASGLYGPGRFGYSINQFSASVAGTSITSGSPNWVTDLSADASVSQSVLNGQITKLTIVTGSIDTNIDLNGIRAFIATSGSLTAANILQQFTRYDAVAGTVIFFVTTSLNLSPITGSTQKTTVSYNKKTDFATRGDFEGVPDGSTNYAVPNAASTSQIVIPEINVQMRSETISAKTRKLKAQWTPEFAQDLNAYHSLDAEAELTGMLSEYISLEIDLEILDMLIQNAVTTDFWSAKIGNSISNGVLTNNTAGAYYNQMSWFQTIGIKLQKISNTIHQLTMRGGANFMVVSPAVATILESIPGFAADTDGASETMKYAFGVQKIGSMNSRYKVYKNPYMVENVILMGFRGNQFLECGAVYAPYVPLIMTPLIYDPTTFVPRKGIMTRYAKKMVRPEYYGKLYVADLNIV